MEAPPARKTPISGNKLGYFNYVTPGDNPLNAKRCNMSQNDNSKRPWQHLARGQALEWTLDRRIFGCLSAVIVQTYHFDGVTIEPFN